jgi:hypothetical protein
MSIDRRSILLCSLLLLEMAVSGCALHKPMSEMAALRGHHVPIQSEPRTRFGISGVANTSISDVLIQRQYAKHPNPEYWEIDASNEHAAGAGFYYLWLSRSRRLSISATMGFAAAGLDVTTSLSRKEYLTVSASFMGGIRGMIQRNFLSAAHHGLVAGIEIRHAMYAFDERTLDCQWCGFGPSDHSYILSFGGRMSGYVEKLPIGLGMISVFGGYAPSVDRPVLGIGVAIGTR